MEDNNHKINKPINWYSVIALCLVLICLGWIIGVFCSVNEPESHNKGDAIGGLTAPIIGFVSSVLIYLSFQAQIKANEKIQEQMDNAHQQTNFEFLINELPSIKQHFSSFKFSNYAFGIASIRGLETDIKWFDNEPDGSNEGYTRLIKTACETLIGCIMELYNFIELLDEMNVSEEHTRIIKKTHLALLSF